MAQRRAPRRWGKVRRLSAEWIPATPVERERLIVVYRFFGQLTQAEIAAKVGLSQMHVSRMLTQSLETLRMSQSLTTSRTGIEAVAA